MGIKQLAFILVLIEAWCCNGCWEDERVALLQLNASFNIYRFNFDEIDNCCDWYYGIECDAHTGRVTRLDLSSARSWDLRDLHLNASLFLSFKQLSYLDLGSNRITNCLQNEGFERLTELKKLKYLGLQNNNFRNNILPSLSSLSFLKSLNISYNKLKGSIYLEELASLKNLEELRLSGNKNISEFVVSKDDIAPANLDTIYLDDMTANGMPLLLKSLRAFSCFKTLYLRSNNLTESTFRHESQRFKNVENLYLDGSVVDENFFRSLDKLPSLKSLSFTSGYGLDNLQGLCNLNYLQSLDLRYNNLSGGLPLCLANLISLQHLDLSGSIFNSTLPLCLSNLTFLHHLDLSDSSLEGSLLSSSLGLLTHLQYLDLSGNNFSSTLPWWLANLTFLQHLDLSANSLVGNLSSSPLTLITSIQYLNLCGNNFQIPISLVPFYNYSNLYSLNINDNELYAEINSHNLVPKFQLEDVQLYCEGCGGLFPRFLYYQHNLQRVDLSDNKLRGEFQHWLLENNTRLEGLYLSNNFLTGTIKLPSHSHVNLSFLDISRNYLNGQIPSKFGLYFPNLGYLDMSDNELNGGFPPSIGNLSLLNYLNLSTNHLSREIPKILNYSSIWLFDISDNDINGSLPMFSSCLNLMEVYLFKNKLHGSLAWAFSNCSKLNILVLKHNFFIGTIPKWIGNLSNLNFLQLADNYLEGEIPIEVCMLKMLSFVDLSSNNLSGQIPSCVNSSQIADYNMYADNPRAYVEFTTKNMSYTYKGSILGLLSGIDLSCNKLTGQIPHELGNLTSIKVLNLSHNSLKGIIPSTLSNLKEIETWISLTIIWREKFHPNLHN